MSDAIDFGDVFVATEFVDGQLGIGISLSFGNAEITYLTPREVEALVEHLHKVLEDKEVEIKACQTVEELEAVVVTI